MKLIPGTYTLELTRKELAALDLALKELRILQDKSPGELNGFDLNSQATVSQIHSQITTTLQHGL